MRRRLPLALLLLLVAALIAAWVLSTPARPNLVLISIDTLRADHLGCYGYDRETSPRIDRLAAEGIRFDRAYSQASWTLPAHMSVMTSQYPHVHGVDNDRVALAERATTWAEVLSRAGYRTAAFVSHIYVKAKWGFGQGFDEFHELRADTAVYSPSVDTSYKAERITDEVASWLEGRPREPFFLFVHYFDPHLDYEPPPPFDRMFDPAYEGGITGRYDGLKPYMKGLNPEPARIGPRELEHVTALYDGEIRYTDTHVGRLLDAIEAAVGLDRCLVVLLSDHGEELDDHGSMEGHGWTLYDEIVRVPLVLRLPGGARAGTAIEESVELIDVAPTALELLDLASPGVFQGRSRLSSIEGRPAGSERPLVFAEHRRFNAMQSVRGERYKLIASMASGTNPFGVPFSKGYELYDLREDPLELEDRYEPSSPIASFLLSELASWRARRGAGGGAGPEVQLSEEEIRQLRALGYLAD